MTQEEFFARYIIDFQHNRLGSGAFGTVYKAYDSVNSTWRAVKISEVKFFDGKEYSLISEFDLIKKISEHKNIANYLQAHQFNTQTGLYDFVIMQFYEDGNLKQIVDSYTLDLEQKGSILKGILEGINCLHKNNIIHRDLKPSNILIARDINDHFVPKISDFGVSKQVSADDVPITSSFSGGTLEYSSPEQLLGSDLKPNTDLWSFGVIAFELLSGRKFFDLPTTNLSIEARRNLIFKKIAIEERPQLEGVISSPYDEIISLCLNYDPNTRVQSAGELLQKLDTKIGIPQTGISQKEGRAYEAAMRSDDVSQLESFLNDFPNYVFRQNVLDKIEVLTDKVEDETGDTTIVIKQDKSKKATIISPDEKQYLQAKKIHTIPAYTDYIELVPQGAYINDVNTQIKILHKARKKKVAFWSLGALGILSIGIIVFSFFLTDPPHSGNFKTYSQNGLYGYLSPFGDTLTASIFTRAELFSSGRARAYIGDTLMEVKEDGSFRILSLRSGQVAPLKLTTEQINTSDLNTLYQLRNQFSTDSLIGILQKRIKDLEAQKEDNSYQAIKNSTDISEIESFIASFPKSGYIGELKRKINDLIKDVSNKSEKEFFEAAKSNNSKTLLEKYLQKYPNGIYKVEVKVLLNAIFVIESKEAWDEAKATNSIERITEYIQQYPTSAFIPAANSTLGNLQKEKRTQTEKLKWEITKRSNNITQINIFITNNPKSEYVDEAKKLVQELESQVAKSAPAVKEEAPDDSHCKTIIGLFANSFKRIPAGTYTTSNQSVKSVSGISIGIYEVTQEQFNTVMNGTNNAYFKDDKNLPIENISFSEVSTFLDKLNSLPCNEYIYRLPTLSEWEYAALGGDESLVWSGSNDLDAVAVYGKKKIGTQRIGSKKPNGYGLYDMSGNVAEFCTNQSDIVRKGGSWYDNKSKLEIRNNTTVPAHYKDKMTGLRLVRVSK